jgi:ABC-2 type transport system permease protein
MSTTLTMPTARLWGAYFNEIRVEFLKSLRTPAFAVPTLFFPIMFYLLFGVLLGSMRGDMKMSLYTFATYGVFGAMGPGLFGFGVSLAIEREQGLLTLKQALPQPAGAYLLARAVMAMLFVAIISILLLAAALLIAKVPLTAGQAVQLFLINVLGALPFCAIGLFVGSWVSGQASPAIVNLIFLPMAFLSGLWWPLQFMPQFLQDIAPTWPAYHLSQMALATVGAESKGNTLAHVAVLVGVTLGFFLLAVRRMHGGGLRLLGAHPKRTMAIASGAAAAVLALALSGVLGGKPAEGVPAPQAESPSAGTGTPGSSSAAAPAGVPAPDIGVIADFDNGSDRAAYGTGMLASGDERQGGSSTAAQRLVAGGAQGSKGALEVTGELRSGAQYPFAGTFFFPEGEPMQGLMDYSARKTLSFHARGDGKRYTLMLFSGVTMGIPLMYGFTAGPEWQKFELNLADFSAHDFKRVRGMAFGAMGENGPFQFQIDDVRME